MTYVQMARAKTYDVIFIDHGRRASVIASQLDREEAIRSARRESRKRGVGRMFLGGSEVVGGVVAIVPGHAEGGPERAT